MNEWIPQVLEKLKHIVIIYWILNKPVLKQLLIS